MVVLTVLGSLLSLTRDEADFQSPESLEKKSLENASSPKFAMDNPLAVIFSPSLVASSSSRKKKRWLVRSFSPLWRNEPHIVEVSGSSEICSSKSPQTTCERSGSCGSLFD